MSLESVLKKLDTLKENGELLNYILITETDDEVKVEIGCNDPFVSYASDMLKEAIRRDMATLELGITD